MISPARPLPRAVLIEDHALVRELLLAEMKSRQNLEVAACGRGVADGIAACRREKPDLVVADWMLPDGHAGDVLSAVAAELPRTRWIFMTASTATNVVREARRLCVHGVVLKRSELFEFRTAIREVVAGRTYFCPASAQQVVRLDRDEASLPEQLTLRETEILRGVGLAETRSRSPHDSRSRRRPCRTASAR